MTDRKKTGSGLTALIFVFVLLWPGSASAAINPELYQADSPEALVLLILESRSTRAGAVETVYLRARVIEVERSETGLAAGDEIEIIYLRDDDNLAAVEAWFAEAEATDMVGEPPDHPPARPGDGQTLRAFLALKAGSAGRVFEPAAAHHSFEPY